MERLPSEFRNYLRDFNRGVHEMSKDDLRAFREIDSPPMFCGYLTGNQSVSTNTLTTVQFAATVDTHGWWNSSTYTYTPLQQGFYLCSWTLNAHDTTAFAASTYAISLLDADTDYEVIGYGNGAALDIATSGSVKVEANGSTTAIKLRGLIFAGTAPTFFASGTGYRSWLTITYLGRRLIYGY